MINHARNAYDVVKRECQPKTAAEMWELWIADVLARKAEQAKLAGCRARTAILNALHALRPMTAGRPPRVPATATASCTTG